MTRDEELKQQWDKNYRELQIEDHHNKNWHLIEEATEIEIAKEKAILDEFIKKSEERKKKEDANTEKP